MKFHLALLLCLVGHHVPSHSQAHAARNTTPDAPWEKIATGQWTGSTAADKGLDLAKGVATLNLDKKSVEGYWVRLSGRTPAATPDFSVWFHVFDQSNRPLYRPLPTACSVEGGRKTCSNAAFILPGGDRIRAAFYSGTWTGVVEPGDLELALTTQASEDSVKRYASLTRLIKSRFYRARDVDWESAISAGALALRAPADIDPLPQAIAILVGMLPGNSHSSVYSTMEIEPGANADSVPLALPACVSLQPGVWKIDMPPTPNNARGDARYLAAAHQCTQHRGVRHWIVNMTANGGGDSALQFGALAPLFGLGPQMVFKNSGHSTFPLVLKKRSVEVGGVPRHIWQRALPTFRGKVTFVVGPGCASACESLAIAAKGRFKMVGQKTAGLTTANESFRINEKVSLQLTVGVMTTMAGVVFPSVEPDVTLDDALIQKMLNHGAI